MNGRVLLIHYTPPSVIGGVEQVMEQHVRLLEERDFSVTVAAGRDSSDGRHVEVIPELDAARAQNARLEKELEHGTVSPAFYEMQDAVERRLFPLAREADVVIAHNAFTLHFSLPLTTAMWNLAEQREQGEIIAWCHDLAWTNPLYIPAMHPAFPWDLLKRKAPNTIYVTVSSEREDELRKLWGTDQGTITVIPNGIDPQRFLQLSKATSDLIRTYDLFGRDMLLLLPVRITRRKNIELGIRVVRSLKDRGVDVFFVVSGPQAPHHPGRSATYLDELRELRADLEVEKDVLFLADATGSNPDAHMVSELYAIADALLFPSAHEGFGLPVLEAGLRRVPVFLSDIPVFREVGGDAVVTFDLKEHPDRIAQTIMQTLDARPSRLFRRVLRDYRWEAIVDQKMMPLLHTASAP